MKIAIIDASVEEARQLSGFIASYFSHACLSQQTTIFNTASDFLDIWRQGAFDLIFIDIFLKREASGIRIAEQIRKEDSQCAIIFTTGSKDFALKGYQVRALYYMLKPITYKKFCATMEYLSFIIQKKGRHYIEVKESRIMVKLPIDDILYTDYYNHYIQIHLADRLVKTYMRFQDFSGMLLCYPQFTCCYRNCIINMDQVISLEKTEFIITTGERLPITRSLRNQIHQQYADYQFHRRSKGQS